MNEHADIMASITVPSPDLAAASVRDARRLFERTLSGWAVDALNLRRTGASELSWQASARRNAALSSQFRKAA